MLSSHTISFNPCTACTTSAIIILPILQIQNLNVFLSDHSAKEWWNSSCLSSETTSFTTTMSCFLYNYLLLLQSALDLPIHLHTKSFGAVIPQVRPLPTHHRGQGKPRDLGQSGVCIWAMHRLSPNSLPIRIVGKDKNCSFLLYKIPIILIPYGINMDDLDSDYLCLNPESAIFYLWNSVLLGLNILICQRGTATVPAPLSDNNRRQ